jgi:hypothetical protein
MPLNAKISPNLADEALRIIGAATQANVPLRLMGGAAIAVSFRKPAPPQLQRTVGDIDLVTLKGWGTRVVRFLKEQGYSEDNAFNVMQGDQPPLQRYG